MSRSSRICHLLALSSVLFGLGACGGSASTNMPPAPRTRFTISGSTSGVADASVRLDVMPGGTAVFGTAADASGHFSFPDLANGDYLVTPFRIGYLFTPPSRSVTVAGADLPALDFAATLAPRYTVGGQIGMTGFLHVYFYGQGGGLDYSFIDGSWSYRAIDGDYTVQPSAAGYVFSPVSRVVVVGGADVPDVAFSAMAAASSFTIAAMVTGSMVDASTFTLSQGGATIGVALSRGSDVSFPGILDGTYVVTPTDARYAFSPTSQAVTVSGANPPALQFVATPH
jgi:hypothetical protein